MAYFVKKIENNTHNHYRYQYLDHITTTIDLRDNYWEFDMDLFLINNFHLPVNSVSADFQLPYQTISNIAFNLASDQSKAKESVEFNKDYCKIFNANFNIDISQNEFLKQDLNNVKMNFLLSLFIDPEAAKGAGSDVAQDDLDKLMNETVEQRWSFDTYYTNTHMITQNGVVDNVQSYVLPFGNECVPISQQMSIQLDNLSNLTSSFDKLVSISSSSPFQVLTGKVKFYYWLELEADYKTLEKTLDIDRQIISDTTIYLNDCTLFDYVNNQVIFDPIGTKGFNIPKYSHGYYELELKIMQGNTINKFVIKNNFNFIENETKPYITIKHCLIKSLKGFKEVTY